MSDLYAKLGLTRATAVPTAEEAENLVGAFLFNRGVEAGVNPLLWEGIEATKSLRFVGFYRYAPLRSTHPPAAWQTQLVARVHLHHQGSYGHAKVKELVYLVRPWSDYPVTFITPERVDIEMTKYEEVPDLEVLALMADEA